MFIILFKFVIPTILLFFLLQGFIGKSKSILVILITSLIFNNALAQNYNYSLIPYPERDGYSVSNGLAYYVFGEGHFGHWTSELFKTGYEVSIIVSILLLALYIVSLLFERKNSK